MEPHLDTIRILLIEDDEDDYLLLKDCLVEQGDRCKLRTWIGCRLTRQV